MINKIICTVIFLGVFLNCNSSNNEKINTEINEEEIDTINYEIWTDSFDGIGRTINHEIILNENNKQKPVHNNVKIDSVSIDEIKRYMDGELSSIFDFYQEEKTGDYTTWSEKLFGRCCSNTDLSFTENLYFKITSSFQNKKYPVSNLSDTRYLTAYAFKKESDVKISLQLDMDNSFLDGKYSNKNLLAANEIIMYPIRISLINGYAKSEELFRKNGKVKEMEIYVNDEHIQTLTLMDTPLVQELTIHSIFKTNDVITLIPKTYYEGEAYDDICITEIQTNLGEIALPLLNEKFNLIELINRED